MKKNVLFLVVDCLRADYVDVNKNDAKGLTPFLKDFSKKGVCFEKMITQSSWTKTSVASIITGTYPFTHNVTKILHKIPGELPTIAEVYRDAGYQTGHFTSNPYLSSGTGYEKGFKISGFINSDDGNLLNKEIIRGIDENADKPFFFYVQYMDPHQPYTVHTSEGKEKKEKVMRKFQAGLRSTGKVDISADELKILKELYAGEVKYSDSVIGNLIKHLEEKHLLEKTIVILTADHGIELMEHGGLYHSAKLYNEMISVPLIMVGPGIKNGRFISGSARAVDLFPTLLEYSDLKVPDTVQGVSLKKYIEDETVVRCDFPVYSERDRTHEQLKLRTLIEDSWKIILYEKEGSMLKQGFSALMTFLRKGELTMIRGLMKAGRSYLRKKVKKIFQKEKDTIIKTNDIELFDLSSDPGEKNNLSGLKKEKEEELLVKLKEFVENKASYRNEGEVEINKEIEERLKNLGYLD